MKEIRNGNQGKLRAPPKPLAPLRQRASSPFVHVSPAAAHRLSYGRQYRS
jgi:hypothetical protein